MLDPINDKMCVLCGNEIEFDEDGYPIVCLYNRTGTVLDYIGKGETAHFDCYMKRVALKMIAKQLGNED